MAAVTLSLPVPYETNSRSFAIETVKESAARPDFQAEVEKNRLSLALLNNSTKALAASAFSIPLVNALLLP